MTLLFYGLEKTSGTKLPVKILNAATVQEKHKVCAPSLTIFKRNFKLYLLQLCLVKISTYVSTSSVVIKFFTIFFKFVFHSYNFTLTVL